MIEVVKSRLWRLLEEKEVSLAMLLDFDGRILWHRGRSVSGKTLETAEGFPKSALREAIRRRTALHERDVVETSGGDDLPQSARALYVKSLIILPVDETFLLYVDSGSKVSFSKADGEVLTVLGGMLRDTLETIKRDEMEPGGIAGPSEAMTRVRELTVRYSLEEDPVLLLGETGVGKSHVAGLLHRYSGRTGPLVVVNVPSIPESLFESEMFGHARGAFTGATERSHGLAGEAEGGTLFLDEVSEVPLTSQAKLLAFVETRRYRAVGETQERRADVRIVAASNRDLAAEVKEKRFRGDLFYRLNVLPIALPPLRQRPEDLRALVEQHAGLLRGKTLEEGFWPPMLGHAWPGNVRELLHVLRRAGISLPGPAIGAEVGQLLTAEGAVPAAAADAIERAESEIRAGGSFWDTAWRRFLDRELNREELRGLLERRYAESGESLRRLSESLHVAEKDYPRFVSALHKYDVHPGRR
jgi:DNA-binding NtrC family response regulator